MENARPAKTVSIVEQVQAAPMLHYMRVALHRAVMRAAWRSGFVRCSLPALEGTGRKSACDAIAAAAVAEIAIVAVAIPHFQCAIRQCAH